MRRVTLAQVFGGAALAMTLVTLVALKTSSERARMAVIATAQREQAVFARRIAAQVLDELGRAPRVLGDVERGIAAGALTFDVEQSVERDLFTRVLNDPHLEEVTFTRARLLGHDDQGEAHLAPGGRFQVTVYRGGAGAIVTQIVSAAADGSSALRVRDRGENRSLAHTPLRAGGKASDPTTHPTFAVAASRELRGRAVWSDLHWSERDSREPIERRRVVVSVQKAFADPTGDFLGVVRVGLATGELDAIVRGHDAPKEAFDGHRVALLASSPSHGPPHLVARLDPTDRVAVVDDELRIVSDHVPPEMRALMGSAMIADLDPIHPNAVGALDVAGSRWLATLHEVDLGEGGTSGWMVAVLAPEARYTADLVAFERMFLAAFGITIALVLLIASSTLSALRRGLARITTSTARMRGFDFAPAESHSAIRDLDEVMLGLERAKTVARAMGKYVPIDLVRRLYSANEEPELGGDLLEVSLMFTDIEGFTTLAEKLSPDELARRLGDYLAAMTTAIESNHGTIDKYIGDAVMALWNVPVPVPEHEAQSCRAALACMKATRELYASPAWAGLPPMVTRFGLHAAEVMVGNFGAPSRLNYTALGDGVNLAARLEPLCKQYGVIALASESIMLKARGGFEFRLIDRVAVKGKTTGIDVYELLGARGDDIANLDPARRYEEAFRHYLDRDFGRAAATLDPQRDQDRPSAVLFARCRDLIDHPPPPEWTGIHIAASK